MPHCLTAPVLCHCWGGLRENFQMCRQQIPFLRFPSSVAIRICKLESVKKLLFKSSPGKDVRGDGGVSTRCNEQAAGLILHQMWAESFSLSPLSSHSPFISTTYCIIHLRSALHAQCEAIKLWDMKINHSFPFLMKRFWSTFAFYTVLFWHDIYAPKVGHIQFGEIFRGSDWNCQAFLP